MTPLLAVLLAVDEDRTSTLGRLFLIALIILSPWWGRWVWRFVRDRRAAARAAVLAARAEAEASRPPEPDALAKVIDAIEDGAVGGAERFDVIIPAVPTVERRPAERAVVDAIVTDALRRSRVDVEREDVNGDGSRTLHCTISGHGTA